MQCRALDEQKFRCKNDAASAYCSTHRDWESDLTLASTPLKRHGGIFTRVRTVFKTPTSDGGKYDVPGWLNNAPTPQVIQHLQNNSDSMVRWMAAFVLRKRRAVEALDALWLTRQNDPIRFVRQQAAVALGKLDTPAVYAPLVEGLHHDRDPGVREACVIALGNLRLPSDLGNAAAVTEITRALEYEENVFVRWDCIVALGQLGDARVETLLRQLQAEEIAQVTRDACRDALAEIRHRTRAPASD